MYIYLNNMEGWKPKSLKNKSFANIQELFEKAMKMVNTFVDYMTELMEESSKKAESELEENLKKAEAKVMKGSSERAGEELEQESIKKQKVDEDKETIELQSLIKVILDEEEVATDVVTLATKPPTIVDWKIHKEGKNTYYQIIRDDRKLQMYKVFCQILKSFSREDLEDLYKLERIVGIKRLLDDLRVTAAQVCVTAAKLIMRMEQYLTHTDYAIWEVIMNGDAPATIASASAGTEGPIPPKTFHGIKDAKTLWEAIKARSEELDKTYDRFQKLISQLEIHGEVISQEDANLKLLRSLPSAWNTHTLIMPFVSLKKICSTNEAVNTTHEVSTASLQGQTSSLTYADDVMFSFFANQSNSPQLANEDLEQIDTDDLEEMDLK
ncbi:hypothetical protein Tco_1115391 [Tanacetum coccineum]